MAGMMAHIHRRTGRIMALVVVFVLAAAAVALVPLAVAKAKPKRRPHYVYLALRPGTSWQWQLDGSIDTRILDPVHNSRKMFDIDLFDTPTSTIRLLKRKHIAVVCYVETGAIENYRPDYGAFVRAGVVAAQMPGYSNENYVNINNPRTYSLMVSRLRLAKAKGCQGIEPDIDDTYFEDPNNSGDNSVTSTFAGFPLTWHQQLAYDRRIASAAHDLGLTIALKNAPDQAFVHGMLPYIGFAIVEQCFEYSECSPFTQLIRAHKAVFEVEYNVAPSQFCGAANRLNFDALYKGVDLLATPRTACRFG
jgi:hypothetical protein